MSSRKHTNYLLDAVADGYFDAEAVIAALCLSMSDEEVLKVMADNDLHNYEYDNYCEYEDDGNALASAGFGTDEDYGN